MLLLAAAVLATSPQTPTYRQPTSAAVQATATIRVVTGVALKLDAPENPGAPPARDAIVRASDGSVTPAKLIEFQ